ncbi:hypothetical protein P6U16_28225 (plasmid) [Rhizobium sp. 32-5/1]|uniref:hypothetical protein n=1 Tax=Rhizobium sp. 32-5/1 TaxID=3019602 RepID=UPI00240DDC7B|nr:hypothetical protein [Rhizobium sp. 32-5/1]WEZ86220.1 hypothetical protein P6U16_28225 [Rhizobium sp. 32-5/1]
MGALQRTGEENEPAVADADQAEYREAVFGQTCPIETAVDVRWLIKGYGNGIIGGWLVSQVALAQGDLFKYRRGD